MLATILAYWAIALPVAYVLAIRLKLGPEGLWYGIGVGLAVAALCHVLRFRWWLKALAAGRVVA
jgi:MATE family multidrug resistance protein